MTRPTPAMRRAMAEAEVGDDVWREDPTTKRLEAAVAERFGRAAVATGVDLADWGAAVDSLSVCFSKGLAAPVGSAVVGDADFVERARRARQQLGGGMRQTGVLAAAALVAIDTMVERLADDH